MNGVERPTPRPLTGTDPVRSPTGDTVTVTASTERRPTTCRCHRCGQTWTVALAPGRRPVVCPTCRPAHEADLAAQRMRRYRAQAQERAAHAAYVQERRVRWFTDRLLREHPGAAAILAEVPYELAADIVEELKQRLYLQPPEEG